MGIIRRHDAGQFYGWPIRSKMKSRSVIKWRSIDDSPVIVFHPSLKFDPIRNNDRQVNMIARDLGHLDWGPRDFQKVLEDLYVPYKDREVPIVHETIEADFDLFDYFELFLEKVEYNHRIPEDEWLWDSTSYWSARDSNFRYIGLNEQSAQELWNSKEEIDLSLILSTPSTILEISMSKKYSRGFLIDTYHNNRFVAFPDLIDSVHKALNDIGNWKSIQIRKDDEDVVFGRNINTIADTESHHPVVFDVVPRWVIPTSDNPRPGKNFYTEVVVSNNFFSAARKVSRKDGYALIKFRQGYWYDDDFDHKKKYYLIFSEARKLRNCILVDLWVERYFKKEINYY